MKLTGLILLSLPLIASANQNRSIPRDETQAGMNEAAGKELEAAETEMARVLDSLMKKAAGKADAVAKLNKAQAAWKACRDAQVDAMWPFPDRGLYGSVYPMCVATIRTNLTKIRVMELRAMLGQAEGDVCNSEWPE